MTFLVELGRRDGAAAGQPWGGRGASLGGERRGTREMPE